MAFGKPKLVVVVSQDVSDEIKRIWRYNGEHRGISQANRYEAFLIRSIRKLSTNYIHGKIVELNPTLRYINMKLRSAGDGHIAVFFLNEMDRTVQVLHLFHSKQDWQNNL